MKRSRSRSNLTKRVLAALLCAGTLSMWGGQIAFAKPNTSGYATNWEHEETDAEGNTWYIYSDDDTQAFHVEGNGDHIQIGGYEGQTGFSPNLAAGKADVGLFPYGGGWHFVIAGNYQLDQTGEEGKPNLSGGVVKVKSGQVLGDNVYGGYKGMYGGAHIENTNVTYNHVYMEGGYLNFSGQWGLTTSEYASGGALYGGFTPDGDAGYNSVTMTGGLVNKGVHGGYADSGQAYGNIVTIKGNARVSNVDYVPETENLRVLAEVNGGYGAKSATQNKVTIGGNAQVNAKIYGGWGANTAKDNDVIVEENATVGYKEPADSYAEKALILGGGGYHTIQDNTVTIRGNATVGSGGGNPKIYGGVSQLYEDNPAIVSGN